jgi:uncharacterized membrane protein YeaQ/YmgE (transglycosylase-associated protein family)
MLRSILGGIAGYVVTFIFVFTTFTAAYFALGTEGTFQPGSYQVSTSWIAASSVLGLVGAIVGGFVASVVGKGTTAVNVLAVIIFVMGGLTVLAVSMSPASTEPRGADVPNMEAMSKAKTPLWVAVLNPLIGIAGAMIGGRLRKQS